MLELEDHNRRIAKIEAETRAIDDAFERQQRNAH